MNGIVRNINGHFHWRYMMRKWLTYANRSICCFKGYANRIFNCNFIGSVEWTSSLSSLASLSFPSRQSPSVKIQERSSHSNRFVAVWKSEEEANLEVSPLTDFTGPRWGANHIREHRELAHFRSGGLIVNWSVMEESPSC